MLIVITVSNIWETWLFIIITIIGIGIGIGNGLKIIHLFRTGSCLLVEVKVCFCNDFPGDNYDDNGDDNGDDNNDDNGDDNW